MLRNRAGAVPRLAAFRPTAELSARAFENRSRVATAARTFAHREMLGEFRSEKQTASRLAIGVGGRPADVAKAGAAIRNVQNDLRTAAIDHDFDLGAHRSMPHDISDQLAENEFGVQLFGVGNVPFR